MESQADSQDLCGKYAGQIRPDFSKPPIKHPLFILSYTLFPYIYSKSSIWHFIKYISLILKLVKVMYMTKYETEIYNIITASTEHLTVEQIYMEIKKIYLQSTEHREPW